MVSPKRSSFSDVDVKREVTLTNLFKVIIIALK